MNNLENNKLDHVEFPDFDKIILICKEQIRGKYSEYGNTWQDPLIAWDWWKQRLRGEIKEIFKTENEYDRRKEIIDAINILSMMFDKADLLEGLREGYRTQR
jgi:hypothetical protein